MEKYSVWLTTILAAGAAVLLAATWETIPMTQKLPAMYMVALAVHEWEELKYPGGFVELAVNMTGVEIKNLGLAKLGLFAFTLWATVIPFIGHRVGWLVASTVLLGYIEALAHLAAARVSPGRFYSPGLVTALLVQLPVTVYGTWYLASNGLVVGVEWLWAFLFLVVPLFGTQAAIVKSNGQSYPEFVRNARRAVFTKEGRKETRRKQREQQEKQEG